MDSFLLIVIACLVELVMYLSCAFEVLCYSKVEICICYGKSSSFCFKNRNLSFKTLLPFHVALACMVHRNVWIQKSDLAP